MFLHLQNKGGGGRVSCFLKVSYSLLDVGDVLDVLHGLLGEQGLYLLLDKIIAFTILTKVCMLPNRSWKSVKKVVTLFEFSTRSF